MREVKVPYGVLRDTNGIERETYPNSVQKQIHEDSHPTQIIIGAWGLGKTYGFCKKCFHLSVSYPNNRGVIARKTYRELYDSTVVIFKKAVPQYVKADDGSLVKIYEWDKGEEKFIFYPDDGGTSEILIRSLDQPEKVTNTEWGFAFIDQAEEIDIETLATIDGHLRLPGVPHYLMLAGNPTLSRLHPFYLYVHSGDSNILLIEDISTYINKDNLPQDYIQRLERMPAELRERFLLGKVGTSSMGKPVFAKEFSSALHVRKVPWIPEHTVFRGWDFGYHHPSCVFSQIDKVGRWVIHREVVGEDEDIPAFSSRVIPLGAEWFPGAFFRDFGDIAGNQKDSFGRAPIPYLKNAHDITVLGKKTKSIPDDLMIIRYRLTQILFGEPMMLVSPDCLILIEGFKGGYHYPKRESDEAQAPIPQKDGFYEHPMDCVRYTGAYLFPHQADKPRVYIPQPLMRQVA